MEKKLFKTFIPMDTKDYIIGRINGILYAICERDPRKGYAITGCNAGWLHTVECTEEQYFEAMNVIEDLYPGVCIFNDNIL